jgi:energy-coupling factor transporter ATP-binding protein EcfA2
MSNDPNDPKRKKKYDKGGYHPENGRRIPPNPPTPPIENEMKIYVNPNNPNDYIYLDAGVVEIYDIPTPQPKAHPMREPMGPPMGPPMGLQDDDSEIDEDLLRLRRVIKNTKKLCERRVKTTWTRKIEGLSDLLDLANHVEFANYTNISLNQEHLLHLQDPLQRLNNLIGMESIKSNIFNQLIFFLQNIEPQFPHMLHTCVQGPPGCGKTELANILADIYANLGIIKEAKVVVARRSDLVAGFLGQTAMKTQEVIDSAKGGVLLIDEAYSLGNEDKKDSFAKECIDTINQNLTEGKADFICIIAGYKEDLEKSFFGFNSGLERRFPYRFTIEDYTAEDLCKIYQTILARSDWKINQEDEKKMVEFFRKERQRFKFNGGDLENFVHFSKLAFAKNKIFNVGGDLERVIQMEDVLGGFELFGENKNRIGKEESAAVPMFMYT